MPVSARIVSGRVVATVMWSAGSAPSGVSRVAEVGQGALDLLVLDLKVGEHGAAARAPVGDAIAPIDQALLVEADKGGSHRLRRAWIHREELAAPVGRGAQSLVLDLDDLAVGSIQSQTWSRNPSRPRSWRLMPCWASSRSTTNCPAMPAWSRPGTHRVGSPQHAVPANQGVLDRGGQRVANVQLAGHVRRRHGHHEGRLTDRARARLEVAAFLPTLIGRLLHRRRIVRRVVTARLLGRQITRHRHLPGLIVARRETSGARRPP